jgi:hypothetical protein
MNLIIKNIYYNTWPTLAHKCQIIHLFKNLKIHNVYCLHFYVNLGLESPLDER